MLVLAPNSNINTTLFCVVWNIMIITQIKTTPYPCKIAKFLGRLIKLINITFIHKNKNFKKVVEVQTDGPNTCAPHDPFTCYEFKKY